MTGPAVSVIIPTLDRPAALQRCIDALAMQTLPPDRFEVIVVDNGSRPPVRPELPANGCLLRCSTPGSYAARNAGLAAAGSTWVAFTDDDCAPAPEWLERALESAEPRRIVAGRVRLRYQGSTPTWSERYDRMTGLDVACLVRTDAGVTANLFVLRAAFDAVGPFEEGMFSGGDTAWCRRAVGEGFEMHYAPDAVVDHPARRWAELAQKTRRVAGGAYQRTPRRRRWRRVAQVAFGLFSPRIRLTARTIHHVAYRPHHALGVWAVTWAVRWVRLRETLRLVAGGKPLR